MSHLTLFCKVGRAARQPLASFPVDAKHPLGDAEALANNVRASHYAGLIASGVAPERIEFEVEKPKGK